jgi:hypothetical protein
MATNVPDPRVVKFLNAIEKRNATYGQAVICFAFVKDDAGNLKISYGLVSFLGRTDSKKEDRKYDYGNFILVKKFVTVSEALSLLRSVFVQQILKLDEFPEIPIKAPLYGFDSIPSGGHHASDQWPSLFVSQNIASENAGQLPSNPLSKVGLPLYPNGTEAIVSFMGLKRFSDWGNISNNFEVRAPDFRARIKNLRLAGNRVTLEVETNESPESDLRVKFYCRNEDNSYLSDDLLLEKGHATFVVEKEPYLVEAHVLSAIDGDTVDRRSFNYRYPSQKEDVVIENSKNQLLDVISKGENETVEFKAILDAKHDKEFLETVVAFANTKGGTIFLGVSDNCRVTGFGEDVKAKIEDLIDGNCEPSIKVQVSQTTIQGDHPITIVEVPEGENKPYILINAGIYVRRGGSDRQIKRTELDDVIAKRNQGNTLRTFS